MMRKIFKNIAMICLAVCVAIGSFFVPVTKKQINSASANNVTESYIFDGSNIMVPLWRNGNSVYNLDYGFISFRLFNDTDKFVLQLWDCSIYVARDTSNYNYLVSDYLKFYYNGSSYDYYDLPYSESDYWFDQMRGVDLVYYVVGTNTTYYTSMGYYVSRDFNNNVLSVELGNNLPSSSLYFVGSPTYYIKYYDSNNNYVYFEFKNYEGNNNRLTFDDRTYYFSPDLSDNQIYNQGYNQGLADNQQNIYNNGYNAGYDIGFDRGRINGVVESNNYSFLGLIGAVVDAPVSILSSLFNFTFLGINLWSFITSLLTIALILFVVKIFMRR